MNNAKVKSSLEKILKNPANNFIIQGSNNNQIIGENIHINHYTLSEKPKVQKIVEDHQYDSSIHISPEQQQKIQEFVEDIAKMMDGLGRENYYQLIYGNIKRKFKVPKYSLLQQTQYNDVKKYLYIEKAKFRKNLRILDSKRFKEYTIDAIVKIWRMLDTEIDLFSFASEKLNKKVILLEKLSINDIDTLYNRVMYQKRKIDKNKIKMSLNQKSKILS
ncbi:hypothetical protein [Campylobacter sp. 7477a]|uniref:hypothetical protein n=1 Tax=Campylobacter sp. 7477a TaxID=2735741 RepID=UPI003014C459|nr:hypothetical protein [Campylobacter sp. 7477a]